MQLGDRRRSCGQRGGSFRNTHTQLLHPLQAPTKAAPPPVFCPPHQLSAQRVTLDISRDQQEMTISLNRKRLEAPLVYVALPGTMTMGVAALGVRVGQPCHE